MTLGVGIHQIDCDSYHADPCVEPSLSSSGIRTLLESTPAHFRAGHPKLSPWPIDRASSKRQDFGNVVHALVLGEGAPFKVLDFDDYKKKDAQLARDFAIENGEVPILRKGRKGYDRALEVASHVTEQLTARFGSWPIGESERTLLWQRDTAYGRIWCRGLADHLVMDDDAAIIIDLKTTELATDDFSLSKKAASEGEDIQAAWYTEGLEAIFPNLAGRVKFFFLFAEVEPPYLVRLARMPEGWLTMARRRIDKAADQFTLCLKEDRWPGWEGEALLQCPPWLESKWMDAELADA